MKNRRQAFKFMNSKYLDDFLKMGRMRIGTASDFRVPDGLTGARSDEHEMSTVLSKPGRGLSLDWQDPQMRAIHDDFGISAKEIHIGASGSLTFNYNCYMFCMSWRLDNKIFDRMMKEFDADICVAILDVHRFIDMITMSSSNLLDDDRLLNRVYYKSKPVLPSYQRPQPFQKRPIFSWQHELRAVWGGVENPAGFMLDVPGLSEILEPVAPSDWRKYSRLRPL